MSEVEQAIEQPETEEVVTNPIEELIDAIASQNFNQAKTHFDDVVADKMHDALEAEKVAVAQNIYSDAEEEIELPLEDDELDELENEYEEEDTEDVEELPQDDEVGEAS